MDTKGKSQALFIFYVDLKNSPNLNKTLCNLNLFFHNLKYMDLKKMKVFVISTSVVQRIYSEELYLL